jgi:hypothetical protein
MPLAFSSVGLVLAAIYAAFAIWVVISERTSPPGGGWISLSGMASYLITFPVSAPMEILGARPDYRKNIDIGAAILVCAMLVYLLGASLEWLIGQMLAGPDS